MNAQTLLFVSGSVVVLAAPVLLVYVVAKLPSVMRHQRSADSLQGPLMLVFATFCIGAGLVVVSTIDKFLVPLSLATIALGLVIGALGLQRLRSR